MSVKRSIVGAMLLAIPLAILGFFLLMQGEFRDNRELRARVDQSLETRADLANLLSLHLNIETGQRGYLLTGDQTFLEPYARGKNEIGQSFRSLDSHVADEPEMAQGMERLRRLTDAKLAFVDSTVALARAGNAAGARAMIVGGRGKRLMDAIRSEVTRLDALEQARLASISQSRDQSRRRVERTTYALLAAFSLLLVLTAIVTLRFIRERQQQIERANDLNERHLAILNGAVDGMLLLDDQGTIRELNPSIERLFGYREDELIGRHNTFLMADPPSMADSMIWLRSVGSAGVKGAGRRNEFTGRRKDGSVFETDVAISRFRSGGEVLYVAIIRDVTERKRVEQMKTEFVSTVSHELRTPLTSIGGSLGLLAAGAVGPLNDKAARLVDIAHNNCQRLIRLINDILDIEKIESGNMRFELRRMPLGPLIARTATANRAFAETHHVALDIEMPPWPIEVMGDPDRLEQLLTNLVSNAIKHSPSGGTVTVRLVAREGKACIEVLDRGSGVPEEFRQRIFGKFAMADNSDSRAKGGTGLGLAIVREIAEKHGGSADFIDRDGGGSCFFFELPLAECEEELAASPAEKSSLPLLLHIDDDRDCLTVVANAFAGRATVLQVSSLSEARRAIETHAFAGAIVDVMVTADNGLDLVPALRAAAPSLPIVVFSALDEIPPTPGVDAVLIKSRTSFDTLVETTMALVAHASRDTA